MSTDQFLHGIEFIDGVVGARVTATPRFNTIHITGTAPSADTDVFPVNKNTLIAGVASKIADLGSSGTLPIAIKYLYKLGFPFVIVNRVNEGASDEETMANIIGGVDSETGQYLGIKRAMIAEQETTVKPRILIAPYFSHNKPVADALVAAADVVKGVVWADSPSGETDSYIDAIDYRKQFGSKRLNTAYPSTVVFDEAQAKHIEIPASIAAAVAESGTNYYESSSMTEISFIQDLVKPVTFEEGNRNTIANLLNENGVTTFINQLGRRLYGNQGASDDPIWKYRAHVRLDDAISEAIVHSHTWAKDRNITRTYTDDVTRGINTYLEYLAGPNVNAIAGGSAWVDPELNDVDQMVNNGKVVFDFDYGRYGIAEHIQFRRSLNNGYVEEVLFS